MPERTFTARHLDTALARVKRELGADALILSSDERCGADGLRVEVRAIAASEASGWREVGRELQGTDGLVESLLAKNGVPAQMARRLAKATATRPRTLGDAARALATALEREVRFEATPSEGCLAFVGPTGAGKTTTLAKLAARAALVERKRVGLISLDGYRVGATAQLEAYADLIGVPMLVARDGASFSRALRRLADADLVFIDTAGRSPRDVGAQVALAEILQSTGREIDVTLCTQATTGPEDMADAIAAHAVLRPTSVTVTKLDEARRLGALVTAPFTSGLPLAWLTTGQRVPEDIVLATADRMVAALSGEEMEQ